MPSKRPVLDVAIIGGGVTGASIGRELSRYRLKIALFEKEEELAFGVSKSNSGIIHPGTQNPPGSLKGRLCVEGNRLTREIARELGVEYKEVGELIVIFSSSEMPRLMKIKEDAEKLGVSGMSIVDRDWLKEHEPNLNPETVAALYAPQAGIISPYRWVYDLAGNAASNGLQIFLSTAVTGIKKNGGAFEIVTNKKTYSAKFVVNAAGLFADDVARMVGVSDFLIKPRKGQEFLLDKKRENITNHLIFPLPSATSKGILVIKTADGNPMIGPTAEDIDDKHDLSTTDEGLRTVLESVKKLVPSIEENDIISYFAGLRPVAGTDFIIRHEDSVPGFINAAGIQSPGLSAAPAIALMVAGLLKENGLPMRKKLFFNRKGRGKLPRTGEVVCRCENIFAGEVRDAIRRGARTLDGIKFRTRAQAGRCHGGFCTTRIMKIMEEELGVSAAEITKRGRGSEIINDERA
ncbi:MAG: NAD(P)/FAD-dependent oxidoreductase [Candidatus Margulisbacteria bacterium]|nr:NAD(P)/FAD-dependent oxidoreductase [Candidatus Margulisiibacteriota bacterium]